MKITGNCSNISFLWMSCSGNRIWQRSLCAVVDEKQELKPVKQMEVKLAIAFGIVLCRKKIKQAEHIVPPVDIECHR
jgi:hypothetical protein